MSYKKEGKPDLTILPKAALVSLAKVLEYGAEKHGRLNYLENPAVTDRELVAAIGRHWLEILEAPFAPDADHGQPHLAAIMANCAMLLHRAEQLPIHDFSPPYDR